METSFSYTDDKIGFFSSDERRWINKIHKLAETHPDEVTILKEPKDNDGCIYAKLPIRWMKIQPRVGRKLTDEQKQIAAERLRASRQKQQS